MDDGGWEAMASTLMQQKYAFVIAFSIFSWDLLITFGQEVTYIWHCPSRSTKYPFLLCRYYTLGYFITLLISDAQWMLRNPAPRKDCKMLYSIHAASITVTHFGSHLILIKKVFDLYGQSAPLAAGLFALHFAQFASSLFLGLRVSSSLNFDTICNGRNVPNPVVIIIVSVACNQCIIWALILRKLRPQLIQTWRRYLRNSDVYAWMTWGFCLASILFSSSQSLSKQRFSIVYTFTVQMTVISIGTCRYLLHAEAVKEIRANPPGGIEVVQGIGGQVVGDEQLRRGALLTQRQHQHPYPPLPRTERSSPSLDGEPSSTWTPHPVNRGHHLDMVIQNFPYLHGALSYHLRRDRTSMTTAVTGSAASRSPQGSSDWNCAVDSKSSDPVDENSVVEQTSQSAMDIEIGSLQSSSGVNSEELRQFYDEARNVGPFMVANNIS